MAPARGVTDTAGLEAGPGPTPLVAVTVTEYVMPSVRPLMVQAKGPDDHEQKAPPGWAVAVYVVMVLPLGAAADQETIALPSLPVVATPVGAPGTVLGVTEPEGVDAGLFPCELVAITVKV